MSSTTYQSSGSAGDVQVQSNLPQELNFALPASLPSAKNFEIRVQPVNAQSFTQANVIQVDIPCGRRGQYLDPATTYIRYRMTYGIPAAGVAGTDFSRLLGTSYSPFIKQECYANNSVVLESINEVGVLANMLLACQLNDADRRGLSSSMGFAFTDNIPYESSSTVGHKIWNSATAAAGQPQGLESLTFEYAMPLIGILGSGTDKFIPIGALYGLRFELTVDNLNRYVMAETANVITSATIDQFEFVGNVIELSPEAQMLIEQANPEKIHIRTATYRQASNILAAQAGAGTNDLLVGIRVSSLKSVYMACSPATAAEGKYAGVNPNLDQGTCLVIAG